MCSNCAFCYEMLYNVGMYFVTLTTVINVYNHNNVEMVHIWLNCNKDMQIVWFPYLSHFHSKWLLQTVLPWFWSCPVSSFDSHWHSEGNALQDQKRDQKVMEARAFAVLNDSYNWYRNCYHQINYCLDQSDLITYRWYSFYTDRYHTLRVEMCLIVLIS